MRIPQNDPAKAARPNNELDGSAPVQTPARGPARSGSVNPGLGAGTDQASLGASLVTLSARALSQPEVRLGLVDQLRGQIAAGTYHASPSQIAERMLMDPLSGLGVGSRG